MKRQKSHLKRIRDDQMFILWQERKYELSVKDIGYIFGMGVAQAYNIIREQYKEYGNQN